MKAEIPGLQQKILPIKTPKKGGMREKNRQQSKAQIFNPAQLDRRQKNQKTLT